MGNIGMPEILVVLLIVVLLFGAKKIPELASGLGKGLKEFKKAQQEHDKDKEGTTAAKTPSPEAEPQKKVS